MKPLRIVFFGTGPFAVPVLERLAALQTRGVDRPRLLTVTRPDRPSGRGRKTRPSPVCSRANELGLEVLAPGSANDEAFLDILRARDPDLFLVADYGEFLGRRFRSAARLGVYNLHASLLPRYRGAAPVAHAILNGDAVTGVTLLRVEREMDGGPLVDAVEVPIEPDETAGELEARLAVKAAGLFEDNLPGFLEGDVDERPQDESAISHAPKLSKSQGAVDWTGEASTVANHIRAMNPWPVAFTLLERQGEQRQAQLRLLRTVVAEPVDTDTAVAGSVLRVGPDDLTVACGSGSLRILELQRAGRGPLRTREFLRGFSLRPGDQFLVG